MLKKLLIIIPSICFTAVSFATNNLFSDVTDSSKWYYNAIKWSKENNIISGYPNGSFKPNEILTEEQFVKIAAIIIIGKDFPENGGHWSDRYYEVMRLEGVQTLAFNDVSKRNQPINRGKVAQILAKALGDKDYNLDYSIDWMYDAKLTDGKQLTGQNQTERYKPNDTLTRAEAVTFLKRIAEKKNQIDLSTIEPDGIDFVTGDLIVPNIKKGQMKENIKALSLKFGVEASIKVNQDGIVSILVQDENHTPIVSLWLSDAKGAFLVSAKGYTIKEEANRNLLKDTLIATGIPIDTYNGNWHDLIIKAAASIQQESENIENYTLKFVPQDNGASIGIFIYK